MNLYIGIDNGVSGALAAMNSASMPIDYLPMPVLKARKGNEIDVEKVWSWISQYHRDSTTVLIEEPGGSKSAKAGASMNGSFHALRAVCVIKKLRWHRITPQQWQKIILPGCKSGDTKPRALAAARQLWPREDFLATDRSKVPHDGIVDALLIAEYGRRAGL